MKHKNKLPLPLNLQLFAEGGEDEQTSDNSQPGQEGERITLSANELSKKIESESDKKVAKALETAKKKWETEFQKKLEAEKEEAERLARLSAKERQEEEFKKKEEALTRRERELLKKELKAQTIAELHEKKLPPTFADFLMGDDADSTFDNIKNFRKTFDEAIEKAVEERLKGEPPKTGGSVGNGSAAIDISKLASDANIRK